MASPLGRNEDWVDNQFVILVFEDRDPNWLLRDHFGGDGMLKVFEMKRRMEISARDDGLFISGNCQIDRVSTRPTEVFFAEMSDSLSVTRY